MNVALFWASSEAGDLLVKKFTEHGDRVLPYGGELFQAKTAESEEAAQELRNLVAEADAVVCMCPPQQLRGKRKDERTPCADGLAQVIAAMHACGKKRLFLTVPVAEQAQEQGRAARGFGKILRRFFPHAYREACKCCEEVRGSGLDYTVVRYMNPYLKHSKAGYVLADGAEKAKTGVSTENLVQCLFDLVVGDRCKGQMPIVYNKHQS